MRSEPLQRHNARRELGLFLAAHDMREVLLGALKFLIHGCHGPCCHYRVKVAVRQPAIDSKRVNNRRNRQNRNTRRNLLPNCYQNMASGFGAESWGIGPFTVALKQLHLCMKSQTYLIRQSPERLEILCNGLKHVRMRPRTAFSRGPFGSHRIPLHALTAQKARLWEVGVQCSLWPRLANRPSRRIGLPLTVLATPATVPPEGRATLK